MQEAARLMDPVPVPDAAALAALPMPMHVCLRCGFLGIRPVTEREGFTPALGAMAGLYHCPRCGFQGPSARIESQAEYAAFVEDLWGAPR
jgi:hypothetical protein